MASTTITSPTFHSFCNAIMRSFRSHSLTSSGCAGIGMPRAVAAAFPQPALGHEPDGGPRAASDPGSMNLERSMASDLASAAPLDTDELAQIDAWWRAANYLSVGQIYLLANPLLREPLRPEHVKPRLLGHWGTTPGLNLIYAHLNRLIRRHDADVLFIAGPGHDAPAMYASTWLDGSYTEHWPSVTQTADGMGRLFRQFSFPGGVPSHVAPETPGSIHEG